MLNWDDPLSPTINAPTPAPAAVEADNNAATTAVEDAATAASMKPVNPDDKRVINGMTDINQLAPFKYPWAWDYFLNANKNHWTPLDINMTQDLLEFYQVNSRFQHMGCIAVAQGMA